MTRSLESLGVYLLCAVLIGLALFVLSHNRYATVNKRFALSVLSIAGWIASISTALAAPTPEQTVVLGRLGFAFASTIPFTLLWMFHAFASPDPPTSHRRLLLPGLFCLAFVLLSLSPWIVTGARSGAPRANFLYGPAHSAFGVYFLLSFIFAIWTLWRTMRSASGLRRLQLRYLFLGILLGGAGAITTNLLVPLLAKTSRYSALGPYFSLLVVSFSAHAIIRYRLLDIRVAIRKGVVYFFAIVAAASIFLGLAELLKRLAGYEKDSIPLLQAMIVTVIVAIFFNPLKTWVQRSFNRYLYRESYDYQRTMREASRTLSTILDLNPLLDYLLNTIDTTFKTEFVAVYLRDPGTHAFSLRTIEAADHTHHVHRTTLIPDTSALVRALYIDPRTLVREEILRESADERLVAAASDLQALGADAVFPVSDQHLLVGLLIVGPKRSGDPYFADDIDLLETLVSQAAIAMKNAQLYREVVVANEYVDRILSTMDSGLISVNAAGDVSLFNSAAERLTGLRAADVQGHSHRRLPHPLASALKDVLDSRTSKAQFEISLVNSEGLGLPLVCSTAILQDKGGSTHGALMVFSDLTRLKELEGEKRRAERLASFGALASGVAHEIKNPLVAIRTFAELLPERFSDTDFRDDFSKVVVREIDRIDDLVGRLRGLAATTPQHVGATDVRVPLNDTIALLRGQLEQTRTTVRCDFVDQAPFVSVDEAQLKQLFLNLCLNAIEAMGTGGEIRVRVSRRDGQGSDWIAIEVSDSGPGIPDSVRAHIFDPFFTTKPRGSGLGLAICRGITDAHRGTIRAENNPERSGTVVIVEFPSRRESQRPEVAHVVTRS